MSSQTWTPLPPPQVVSDSLQTHRLQYARLPCTSPTSRAYSNLCPFSWWCHPTISSSVVPFSSCLQFCPASGSFPVNRLFTSGGQSIAASASVPPMNIHGWFPLRLTSLTSLLSKGLSRVFSSTTVWRTNSSVLCLLYDSALTTVHNYWKDHSLDYADLCQQSGVFAF